MMVRAAVHVHSEWSYDARWTLPDLRRALGRRGYGAVLMTEHDKGFSAEKWNAYKEACAAASSDGFLVVPGIEYSDSSNTVHILTWGPLPFLGENRETGDLLREVRSLGGVAVLAHPSRKNAWKSIAAEWLPLLSGIELWNRKADGWAPSADAETLLGMSRALPFVGLDFHRRRQFFPLAMRINVVGGASESSVVGAIREGRCEGSALGMPATWYSRGVLRQGARVSDASRKVVLGALRRVLPRSVGV
jgi:hypothetical protein